MPPRSTPRSSTGLSYWRHSATETAGSLRAMFHRRTLGANVSAGITVALVALPLNLALAIACGLPPSVGLVTGAIAGIIGAIVGASRFQITGPEVALAPITLEIVLRHGFSGLLVVTFLAGLIQIGFGLFRVGRLVRAIPVPVIGGFLAAVGLLVFDSQLPRLLGLPPEVTHVSKLESFGVLRHVDPVVLAIGVVVVAVVLFLPRLTLKVPSPLAALAVAVAAGAVVGAGIPTVAPIEGALPLPALPAFAGVDLVALLPEAVALATLASIDSLLCAVSVDSRMNGERTRSDQELVAQGLANIGSACFGGMPVAAAVVRSVAAVEAGASTRLAPITQSVILGLVLVALAPLVSHVPLVALAAILVVIGYRLIDWRQLAELWRMARFEATVFLLTAAGILLTDFVLGVGIGVVASLAHFARQQRGALASEPATIAPGSAHRKPVADVPAPRTQLVRFEGPLFFASQDRIEETLGSAAACDEVVVDLGGVSTIDISGARALVDALRRLTERDVRVRVMGSASEGDEILQWILRQIASSGVEVSDVVPPMDGPSMGDPSMNDAEGAWMVSRSAVRPAGREEGVWLRPTSRFNGSPGPSSNRQEMNHGPNG